MAVKTNKEYTAMQHEIATAEAEVQRREDAILEHMLEADDLTAEVDGGRARRCKTDRAEVERERATNSTFRARQAGSTSWAGRRTSGRS